MFKKFTIIKVVVSLFVLFPLIFGTSPRPAPYHQYRVSGDIERLSGGPRENYVVSLVGIFSGYRPDSIIDIISYSSEAIDKCITDTSGHFFLEARSHNGKADSIAIKVSAADKQPFISSAWLVPGTGIEIMGESILNEESGCNGCRTVEPASESYVVGYLYAFQNQKVVIPD